MTKQEGVQVNTLLLTLKADCSSSFKEWISCLRYWISDSLIRSNTCIVGRFKREFFVREGVHLCVYVHGALSCTSSSYTSLPWVSGDSAVSPLKQERIRVISTVRRLFNSYRTESEKNTTFHMKTVTLVHVHVCVCSQTWL